jgi:hypothetical protein
VVLQVLALHKLQNDQGVAQVSNAGPHEPDDVGVAWQAREDRQLDQQPLNILRISTERVLQSLDCTRPSLTLSFEHYPKLSLADLFAHLNLISSNLEASTVNLVDSTLDQGAVLTMWRQHDFDIFLVMATSCRIFVCNHGTALT